MQTRSLLVVCCIIAVIGCNRKQSPQHTADDNKTVTITPAKKIPLARVIVVNDKAAKKAVDGRMYYDLDGHRYWRNYNDGKYYLFNKSMYNDPAFTPHPPTP